MMSIHYITYQYVMLLLVSSTCYRYKIIIITDVSITADIITAHTRLKICTILTQFKSWPNKAL